MSDVKTLAIQLANVAIAQMAATDKTGAEKKATVCLFLATLDDGIISPIILPNTLEAKLLEVGADKVVAFLKSLDKDKDGIPDFVETCYCRIKHLLEHLIPGGKDGTEV